MKSIILEGPNGSGKSTLGKQLSRILGMKYIHAGPSPGNHSQAVQACLDQHINLQSGCILDRVTPISRLVYERPIEEHQVRIFQAFLLDMLTEARVIYCTAEGEFTEKEYYPPGHMEEIVKTQHLIRDRYESVMSTIPHIPFNWSTDRLSNVIIGLDNE